MNFLLIELWDFFTIFYIFVDVSNAIEENGKLEKPSQEYTKELLGTPLKCHKCNFIPKNIPNLKEHLKNHL